MKKVALLVQDLDSDYFNFMVEGAERYCKEHNLQLMIFIIRGKNWSHGSFDYQFYAAIKLVSKGNIDGILLATNTYCQNIPESKRADLVRELAFLPLVSIGAPVPGISSICSETLQPHIKAIFTLCGIRPLISRSLGSPVSLSTINATLANPFQPKPWRSLPAY